MRQLRHPSAGSGQALKSCPFWREVGKAGTSPLGSFHRKSTEGRSRRSCGSTEVHTAQSHPSVGTPIEVPVPRNVSRPSIASRRSNFRSEELTSELQSRHYLVCRLLL